MAVAAANGGHYTVDAHLRFDPHASEAFAEAHVRRLEAMRRVMRSVDREPDGRWAIASDHLERAAAFEARLAADRPVTLDLLSDVPLDKLKTLDAATWLDRELTSPEPVPLRDAGFGREVRAAQTARQAWLIDQDLAQAVDGRTTYRPDILPALQRRELLKVAGQLSDELGKPFIDTRDGERLEGLLRRRVDLASGRFALVEKSREFTLVPWRPVLERRFGKPVAGILRTGGLSWTIGRGRPGPSID